MTSADKREYGEQLLTRYLLGVLSQEEAERLDELSIADEEFASRLNAVENDLVDSYVRDELSGETLERFKSVYLPSSKRLEKIEFANTLLRWHEKAATAAAQASPTKSRNVGRWFGLRWLSVQWGLAVAGLLLMSVAVGYLLVENARLKQLSSESSERQIALAQRAQELERELGEQRSANAGALKELETLRKWVPVARTLRTIAVLLLPPTRGASQITDISVPPGTERVTLRLQLESNDFRVYRVVLKEPASNQIVWRSAKLRAKLEGEATTISISLPAALLKQQNYVVELTGVPARGTGEFVSSYPFKVVRE